MDINDLQIRIMVVAIFRVWIFQPVSSWTDFVAAYLVFLEAAAAGLTIAVSLRKARATVAAWMISACLVVGLSLLAFFVGSSLYYVPPVDFVGPITSHTSNSFPSHHALLAAVVVALVYMADAPLALPFAVVSLLIDWALVLGRHHHLIDVAASDVIVVGSSLSALAIRRIHTAAKMTKLH